MASGRVVHSLVTFLCVCMCVCVCVCVRVCVCHIANANLCTHILVSMDRLVDTRPRDLPFDFKMAEKFYRVLTWYTKGTITAYKFSRQCKAFTDG